MGAVLFCIRVFSQAPAIEWQKCYGSTLTDIGSVIRQTTDGGFILSGFADTSDAQVTGNHGGADYWIVKTDSLGNIQWETSLGGSGTDYAGPIIQTRDGGYIVAGESDSKDGNVTGNHGSFDYWIVKLNATGNIQWQESLGGDSSDEATAIRQTTDGGYIVAGYTWSVSGEVTGNHGKADYWVVKLDSAGAMQWEKAMGGSGIDLAYDVLQTNDGGYIVAGTTLSNDGQVTGYHPGLANTIDSGNGDMWIVKLDSAGNMDWEKCYGGSQFDAAYSIQQTTDGGYAIAGISYSTDGDVTGHHGGGINTDIEDIWIVKITSTGTIQWENSYGGTDQDDAYSIQQTFDGGYLVYGFTNSLDGDVSNPMSYTFGYYEDWLLKLSSNGLIEWNKSLGGADFGDINDQDDYDIGSYAVQNSDSSFTLIGTTHSTDGEVSGNHGLFDYSVFRLQKEPAPCMVVSITSTQFSCTSLADTTVVTVTSGTADSINWGDGVSYSLVSTPLYTHNYMQPGVYDITLVDDTGCIKKFPDNIVNLGISIDTDLFVNPACNDSTLGQMAVTVKGGVPPYSYLWSTGATTDTIKNLAGGNYSVSVTDSTGCLSTMRYDLYRMGADGGYYVYCTITYPNCSDNGQVATTVYNGTPPYTYLWDDNRTTATITGLGEGDYEVTVTDSVGCVTTGRAFLNMYCQNYIYGTAFNDPNNNCAIDSGEPPLENMSIIATDKNNNNYYGNTDSLGHFSIAVPDTGAYTLSGTAYYTACSTFNICTTNPVVFTALGDTSYNNNVGVNFSGFDLDLEMSWGTVPPCPCYGHWQRWYWISFSNFTPFGVSGPVTLTFQYDPILQYFEDSHTIWYTSYDEGARTFTWVFDTVTPFAWWQTVGPLQFNYLRGNPDQPVRSEFKITPYAGDCDTTNNHYIIIDSLYDSHDPNEKDVSPAGNLSDDDTLLTYNIRFQNTGNDTAWFITVKDTLSPYLDPASVRTIATSPPYTSFTLSGPGILTWVFNPAYLPDSLANAGGSVGFINFQVNTKKNLPLGAIINNSASIYFDYNTPVVTNTTSSTISNVLSVQQVAASKVSVNAFPNPFSNETDIMVTGVTGGYDFELYDVTGRLLRRIPSVPTNPLQLSRDGLAAGVYLYGIKTEGTSLAFGKLVVQ